MSSSKKYASIRSITELRYERRYINRDISQYEKKILNDYSVFKASFSIASLASAVIKRIPYYDMIAGGAKLVHSFIAKILLSLRRP